MTVAILVLTVLAVQRYRTNTVTEEAKLPVLVSASARESEGVATFGVEDRAPLYVRAFRDADLRAARKHLGEHAAQRFTAVMRLKKALENPNDPIAIQESIRALAEANERLRSGPENPLRAPIPPEVPASLVVDFAHGNYPPRLIIERMEHQLGLRPGPKASKDPGWMLSYVLSAELREVHLVLWWTKQRFKPALWCPDMKTAFYVRVLLGVVAGKGFCVCPHCEAWFVQDRPDQTYCSVAHREAHRVARWRAQQKQKATQGSKRRRNGTQKTR